MGLNDFLFLGALFHEVTSLHPPSFHRNDFSTCIRTLEGGGGGLIIPVSLNILKNNKQMIVSEGP